MKKFFKSAGWTLLYIAVYFGASIAIGMIVGFVIVFSAILKDPEIVHNSDKFMNMINNDIGKSSNLLVIVTSILSFFIFLLIYKGRKKNIFRICRFEKTGIKNIGLIFCLGMTFNIFISYLYGYICKLHFLKHAVRDYEKIAEMLTGGNFILTLIAVVLVAPFFEEIFFRGVLFNEMKNGMPLVAAFIIQALLFGLFHGNLIQGSYAFLLALFLCLVYLWFRSIWANIALHLSFNLTSVFTDFIPDRFEKGLYAIIITIASLMIVAVLLFFSYKARIKDTVNPETGIISA